MTRVRKGKGKKTEGEISLFSFAFVIKENISLPLFFFLAEIEGIFGVAREENFPRLAMPSPEIRFLRLKAMITIITIM